MQVNKNVLRQGLRERRRSLSGPESAWLSGMICRSASLLPAYVRACSIGVYCPVDGEVDPDQLKVHAVGEKKSVSLPVIDATGSGMFFALWTPDTLMEPGPWGILQPRGSRDDGDRVAESLEVIFLPVVGFDRHGWRLGYGGGYFDRYLAHHAPGVCRVGLAYGFQEVDAIPAEPHDQKLHYVVTERGVMQFQDPPFFE
ncbi:MAG: 5-formyltetrahydrofolate cyclo-ligase [Magnetococcales bacterium]|nr:5-formyltetrahydrofolate cyclo-ligase [Magnetococcales bacterium]